VTGVLDDAVRAKGIVIADKTANDQLTRVLETSFPAGRDAFLAKLAGVGVSQPAILDEVKRQLADAQLFDQVTRDVPVPTDQEVAQAYQQRRAEMAVPEKRRLRNIVLDTQQRADQVRAQLASGTDFAALAGQVTLDDSTKAKGGDLGAVTRDQLEQPYADAAFTAAPSAVFGRCTPGTGGTWGRCSRWSPRCRCPWLRCTISCATGCATSTARTCGTPGWGPSCGPATCATPTPTARPTRTRPPPPRDDRRLSVNRTVFG